MCLLYDGKKGIIGTKNISLGLYMIELLRTWPFISLWYWPAQAAYTGGNKYISTVGQMIYSVKQDADSVVELEARLDQAIGELNQ